MGWPALHKPLAPPAVMRWHWPMLGGNLLTRQIHKIAVFVYVEAVRVLAGAELIDRPAFCASGINVNLLSAGKAGGNLRVEYVAVRAMALQVLGIVQNQHILFSLADTKPTANDLLEQSHGFSGPQSGDYIHMHEINAGRHGLY